MPPTTAYSFGDIVLVPFPFTDQSATKRRPAVVVSGERYNRERADLIIMAVTSRLRAASGIGEVQLKDWKAAGLLKPSVVKPVVTTIATSMVIRALGRLKNDDRQALRSAIAGIIG
jgi:mRNA interferase MazF